jgi:hypothetical protein
LNKPRYVMTRLRIHGAVLSKALASNTDIRLERRAPGLSSATTNNLTTKAAPSLSTLENHLGAHY